MNENPSDVKIGPGCLVTVGKREYDMNEVATNPAVMEDYILSSIRVACEAGHAAGYQLGRKHEKELRWWWVMFFVWLGSSVAGTVYLIWRLL